MKEKICSKLAVIQQMRKLTVGFVMFLLLLVIRVLEAVGLLSVGLLVSCILWCNDCQLFCISCLPDYI